MVMISRKDWNARSPRGSYTTIRSTKGVKIHYTGGAVNPAILDDHDRCLRLMRDIQNHHMDGNGWMDFAYSLGACPHGDLLMGRGPKRLVAANGGGLNAGHYAIIALIGSKGLTQPTDALLHAILDGVEYLREEGGAGREVKGHRDGYNTSCPGEPLYAWIRRGAPRPGGEPPATSTGRPAWPGRLFIYRLGRPRVTGADVRQWQTGAKALGYALQVDGWYGEESRTVCRHIQRRAGLDDDGIVGRDTWAATFPEK
ncbi:N-acetylmuramoyl-L-alanine amidase [Planobispora longispora]|uniref:N-acetylmuramoyl-L-alanine amidase n=1 Tax=Planobispora longispora TaxID=28887 RepID=A0A8J3W4T9_9ACTN|nr:N-acetylmuramoyl-L-alanine amidase [Planobispora longispora]BFE85843.1 N-acetylmuramoyl-L-alanine amidase [Planobispora longispora]GIH76127.1 N-acetylmuramoyl-L-alanine amidase [Planobispora longispora]